MMANNNNNEQPDPSGPGWWWIRFGNGQPEIANLETGASFAYLRRGQRILSLDVDDERIEWLSPAPMPGEWVPRALFDDLWELYQDGMPDDEHPVVDAIYDWREQNPAQADNNAPEVGVVWLKSR